METVGAAARVQVVNQDAQRRHYGPWDYVRWTLLGLLIVVPHLMPYLAPQPSTLAALKKASFAELTGVVTVARDSGGGPLDVFGPGKEAGYGTVQVHWQQGRKAFYAEVVEASPGVKASEIDGTTPILREPIEQWINRECHLSTEPGHWYYPSSSLGHWNVPTWFLLLLLGCVAALVFLITSGPAPWRATRWAWFWLCATPLGLVAFLVLSGPTPLITEPKRSGYRLTGGWAFLLGLFLHGIRLWW